MVVMRARWWISLGVVSVALVASGGVFWYIQVHRPDDAGESRSNWLVPFGQDKAADNGDGKSVALNDASPTPSTAASKGDVLSVSRSADGGQLGSSVGTSTTSNSNNQTAKSSAEFNPNDFSQYEKYKNESAALYQDFQAGTGPAAVSGKTLTVNYRGWLTNGQEFDESYKTGKPFSFVLGAGSVIPGWEEAIGGMKVGGKRRLVVPPAVGYGQKGMGPIPPNALLVFDVELVAVQ
jgi:FKBP-type peptidyl-prolyl cis-trans isomerase